MTQVLTKVANNRKSAYDIDPVFIDRWSPRSFLEKEIPEQDLMSIFEAARWAPSAFNIQPWRFILARTKEDLERFHSFILPNNLSWCKKAPALALIISKKTTDSGENKMHAFDSGSAWGFLSLEAVKKGLMTHPMGGFDREMARSVLGIPEEYDVLCLIAIGYQGEKDVLPEVLQEREKPSDRRPLEDTLFEGTFK